MSQWKALPEGLDPQVREFAGQLRRIVDRSGLSLGAVADRTGYSRLSWERYLNGGLRPPREAMVALAGATSTNEDHLITMWELAERAWGRTEDRRDPTMGAARVAQARAALGEFGPPNPAVTWGVGGGQSAPRPGTPGERTPASAPAPTGEPTAYTGASAERAPGSAPSPVPSPAPSPVPGFPPGGSAFPPAGSARTPYPLHTTPIARPSGTGDRTGPGSIPGSIPGIGPGSGGGSGGAGGSGSGSGSGSGPGPGSVGAKRKVAMFFAGLVGALLVIAAAVLFTDFGGDGDQGRKVTTTPTVEPSTSRPPPPAGVRCSGSDCTGRDPDEMGCGGEFARTVSSVTVDRARVEVRYSKTCQAAWARITQAAPGDTVGISADGKGAQEGLVDADNDAYTPMTAVNAPTQAKACATLKTGATGCTKPQSDQPDSQSDQPDQSGQQGSQSDPSGQQDGR